MIVTVEPYRRFAWLERFVLPFAFDRYHEFHLVPIDDGRRTRDCYSERRSEVRSSRCCSTRGGSNARSSR